MYSSAVNYTRSSLTTYRHLTHQGNFILQMLVIPTHAWKLACLYQSIIKMAKIRFTDNQTLFQLLDKSRTFIYLRKLSRF